MIATDMKPVRLFDLKVSILQNRDFGGIRPRKKKHAFKEAAGAKDVNAAQPRRHSRARLQQLKRRWLTQKRRTTI